MRFADIRTEWRVDDIERKLAQKAESHELNSLKSDVDRLERSVRDISSLAHGLCHELEACQEEIRRLKGEDK